MEIAEVTLKLLSGFGSTCIIFFATLVFALPLGLLISFGSMCRFKPVKALFRTFVWIIRGTPLMLQIIAVSFVPRFVFGVYVKSLADFLGTSVSTVNLLFVIVAFVINYSCYFSEIFRGGIGGVSNGQYEAGQVLGMTKFQIFRHIIIMQVVKKILPAMSNEIITLVKDTSLAKVISVVEIVQSAYEIVNLRGVIWPLFYAGAFFLIFIGILTILFNYLEKRLSYYKV